MTQYLSTNEVGRCVVRLPANATFYSDQAYIPLVYDSTRLGTVVSLLMQRQRDISYLHKYEIFSRLCSERAQRVVDGDLKVDGRTITPEKYLNLWRNSIEQHPVDLQDLASKQGLQIRAVFAGPVANLERLKSSWSSSPLESFRSFFDLRLPHVAVSHDRFVLTLDLALPGASCEVFYAHSMLPYGSSKSPSDFTCELEVHRLQGAATLTELAQGMLFNEADPVEA